MPAFAYTARELTGKSVTGTLEAGDRGEALKLLADRRLFPVDVAQVAEKGPKGGGRVGSGPMAQFYQQMADLLGAGVPLLRALQIIADQTADANLGRIVTEIRADVAEGSSLGDAMRRHPAAFPDFVISLIQAGEEGSFVEEVLARLAAITQHQTELKGQVLGAMAYPAFLLLFGAGTVIAMLVFFVPKFQPIFDRMIEQQGGLPAATEALLFLSESLKAYWWLLLALLIGGALAFRAWVSSPNGRRTWHSLLLWETKIGKVSVGPGTLFRPLATSRVCRVLGTMLGHGVPLLRALQIARGAAGNVVMGEAIARASEQVTGGRGLAQPLRSSGEFSSETVEMIAVGEESNRLDRVLVDIAEILERRLGRTLDLLVRMLEPTMLLVLAAVVTFIVAALLLPILQSSTLV